MSAQTVRLSICIPVYNFGAFIGQTLDSIWGQCPSVRDAVEVLVVDGASADNTAAIVTERATRWSQLRYVRLPQRGGIDADIGESVRLARGEYCWLFSGDDLMRDGALARALGWLGRGHDVYLCKHTMCDRHMKVLHEHPVFRSETVRIAELSDPQQRLAYMRGGLTSEAVFSFISGLIVRRDKWLSVPDPQEFMGSCWGHVARLFTAAQTQLRVCYVGEIWLDKRGDNDSFGDRGVVHRLGVAVDGFHRLADRFFGHASPEAAQIRRMVRNDFRHRQWLSAKCRTCEAPATESRRELDRLIAACYSDPDITCRLVRTTYRLMPVVAYRTLQWVYHRMRRTGQTVGVQG